MKLEIIIKVGRRPKPKSNKKKMIKIFSSIPMTKLQKEGEITFINVDIYQETCDEKLRTVSKTI